MPRVKDESKDNIEEKLVDITIQLGLIMEEVKKQSDVINKMSQKFNVQNNSLI